MSKKENNSLLQLSQMAAITTAVTSRYLIQGLSASTLASTYALLSSPVALGALIGAGAYCLGKLFLADEEEDSMQHLIDSINSTVLNVEVDDSGNVSTTVNTSKTEVEVEPVKAVQKVDKNGATVYYIENLTINVKTEVVHQLNVNPKEVINRLTKQIEEASQEAVKQLNQQADVAKIGDTMQTHVDVTTAGQVNVNPQNVHNHPQNDLNPETGAKC